MNTFEIGKIYSYVSLDYWFYRIEEHVVSLDFGQIFLVLDVNVLKTHYCVFILTGNNKGKKVYIWLIESDLFPKEKFSDWFKEVST